MAGVLGRLDVNDVNIVSLDVVERTAGMLAADDLVGQGPLRMEELVEAFPHMAPSCRRRVVFRS